MDGEDVVYVVRVWIDPQGHDAVLGWLRAHHVADVVAQPGFRWARCVRLEQDAEDGWLAYVMLYGVESREALLRYFESPITQIFAEQRKPFAHMLRMDRAWGKVEIREGKAAAP